MTALPDTAPPALRRISRTATAALGAMAGIFLLTHLGTERGPALLLLRAMAEAGMIGGLADWFAVEALFRRPLGLPIPHTALLPRNQARAAANIGRFIEARFLGAAQIRAAVLAARPAERLLAFAAAPGTSLRIGRAATGLAAALLAHEPSPRLRARLRRLARGLLSASRADVPIARLIAEVTREGARAGALDDLLRLFREGLESDPALAIRIVQDNSRWWIAAPVDRRIAGLALEAALNVLATLEDKQSPLRRDLDTAVDRLIDRMQAEGTLVRLVEAGRQHVIGDAALGTAIWRLAESFRRDLGRRIAADPEGTAEAAGALIGDMLTALLADDADRAAFDDRLAAMLAASATTLAPAIRAYLGDTIAAWAPDDLVHYIESEVGRDLQFIRINGTLLGALIGGAIFIVSALLGP